MTLQRMTVAFFLTVFSLVGSHAGAGESDSLSFARYAAGNFSQVPGAVRSELAGRLEDSSAFLSRVRLATNSFAQDPAIALSELLSVYDAAAAPAATFGYGDRIRSERGAVADLAKKEAGLTPASALQELDAALAIPRDGLPNILRRSTRIFAVTLVARRKIVSAPAEREWLFVAGKAVDADTRSGEAFLEAYLEVPDSKGLSHRGEALRLLERAYRDQDGPRLTAEHAARIRKLRPAN